VPPWGFEWEELIWEFKLGAMDPAAAAWRVDDA